MGKDDLVKYVCDNTGLSKAKAGEAVSAVLGAVVRTLRKREEVSLPGFGKFTTKQRAARTGRNPQTGAPIEIPSTISVAFKAGKPLTDAVNGR